MNCLKHFLIMASILLMYCGNSHGTYYNRYVTVYQQQMKINSGDCEYKGYIPGGRVKGIEPIPSPVAKGFKTALSFIAGIIAKSGGHTKRRYIGADPSLDKILLGVDKVIKVADKFAPAMSVFAAAFGLFSELTKPTPNEILENVNKAFAEITKDINNRLKIMEGYVDGRVIKLEKNLIKSEFATLQRYFTRCIRETTDPEVRTCQRLANKQIDSALPTFQKLGNTFRTGGAVLDFYHIRRLEATLPSFRDYASLHLFSLQTLVNSYKSDPPSEDVKNKLKLYLGDLKFFEKKYRDYAYWAYDQIYQRQITDNINRDNYADVSRKVHDVWEGWPGALTYKKQLFPVKCNPEDKQADINKCELKHLVRWDGKSPSSNKRVVVLCKFRSPRYTHLSPDSTCLLKSLKMTGKYAAVEICKKYFGALEKDLKTYWKKELLDLADVWFEVSKKAAEAPELA